MPARDMGPAHIGTLSGVPGIASQWPLLDWPGFRSYNLYTIIMDFIGKR